MRYLSIFVYCAYFAFVLVRAQQGDVVFREGYAGYNRNKNVPQKVIEPSQTFRTPKSIPIDMLMKMSSISDENEFINQFFESDPLESLSPSISAQSRISKPARRLSRLTDARHIPRDDIEPIQTVSIHSFSAASPSNTRLSDGGVLTRFGANEDAQSDKKNGATRPKFASCQPELRTVSLRDTDDPTVFYYPGCTRVDRCGGCCATDLLSCQPTAIEYKNFSVLVGQYYGGSKFDQRGRKIVTVETHIKCTCDCRIKAKDCNFLQEYKDCRCVCTNKAEEAKCKEDKNRLWNPSTCSCQCRQVQDCATGLSFDEATCSCQPYSKQYPPEYSLDRSRYNIGSHP